MTRHQLSCVGLHCVHLSGCCPVKLVLNPALSLGLEQVGRRLDSGLKPTSPSPKEPLANSAIATCAIPVQSLGAVSHNNCECPILPVSICNNTHTMTWGSRDLASSSGLN